MSDHSGNPSTAANPHPGPALRIRLGALLPHWTRDHATYSIVFRLADSLPGHILQSWRLEREHIIARAAQMERQLTEFELDRLEFLYSEKVESHLNAGHGGCWMRDPRVARIVRDALLHFNEDRYRLFAWCVMPNHVHAVVRPFEGRPLPRVLHSWKSFTALSANRLLERSGPFWHTEYYDHLIRDGEDFSHAVRYVLQNPEKANLGNWPWMGKHLMWNDAR
jgi:REP element-mobilizing transposase RayT